MGTRESKQELDFVRRVPSVRVLKMIGDAMREREAQERRGNNVDGKGDETVVSSQIFTVSR